MNGPWYPWSEGVNGNQPGSYVQAWRHVHDIFRAEGVTNVSWVWSPFVRLAGTRPLSSFYPGDAYVNWVALDGYNGGSALDWGGWLSFEQIFGPSLAELRALTTKPIAIAEVASAEAGGSKALWIKDFFASLERRPEIRAFSWFHFNKETDWRITSSSSAQKLCDGNLQPPLLVSTSSVPVSIDGDRRGEAFRTLSCSSAANTTNSPRKTGGCLL